MKTVLLGFAVIVLLLLAGGLYLALHRSPSTRHLEDLQADSSQVEAPPPPPTTATLVTEPPLPQPDGSLQLRWQPVAGADGYVVRLFSSKREEVGNYDTPTNSLTLRPSDLAGAQLPSKTIFWRVLAQRNEADIAYSTVARAQLP